MSGFRVYTTGGRLRHPPNGQPEQEEETVIDRLVQSSRADIHFDPEAGRLIHRFEAKCRRNNRGTRIQEYYAVYSDPGASPENLVNGLARNANSLFETDRWTMAQNPDRHASPALISRLAKAQDRTEVRLTDDEEYIIYALSKQKGQLEIGMTSHEAAVRALRLFSDSNTAIVLGDDIDAPHFGDAGLVLEYDESHDYEPLTTETKRRINTAEKKVKQLRLSRAVDTVRQHAQRFKEDPQATSKEKVRDARTIQSVVKKQHDSLPSRSSERARSLLRDVTRTRQTLSSDSQRRKFDSRVDRAFTELFEPLHDEAVAEAKSEFLQSYEENSKFIQTIDARREDTVQRQLLTPILGPTYFDGQQNDASVDIGTIGARRLKVPLPQFYVPDLLLGMMLLFVMTLLLVYANPQLPPIPLIG